MKKLLFIFLCSFGIFAHAQASENFAKRCVNKTKNVVSNIWNCDSMIVGRNFTAHTFNAVGYLAVFIAWSNALGFNTRYQRSFTANDFVSLNVSALALFMTAEAIKAKENKNIRIDLYV